LESNSLKLARLRKELNDAEWNSDIAREDALRREIARLELMLELGTSPATASIALYGRYTAVWTLLCRNIPSAQKRKSCAV
jgi:hypothetical protein